MVMLDISDLTFGDKYLLAVNGPFAGQVYRMQSFQGACMLDHKRGAGLNVLYERVLYLRNFVTYRNNIIEILYTAAHSLKGWEGVMDKHRDEQLLRQQQSGGSGEASTCNCEQCGFEKA